MTKKIKVCTLKLESSGGSFPCLPEWSPVVRVFVNCQIVFLCVCVPDAPCDGGGGVACSVAAVVEVFCRRSTTIWMRRRHRVTVSLCVRRRYALRSRAARRARSSAPSAAGAGPLAFHDGFVRSRLPVRPLAALVWFSIRSVGPWPTSLSTRISLKRYPQCPAIQNVK